MAHRWAGRGAAVGLAMVIAVACGRDRPSPAGGGATTDRPVPHTLDRAGETRLAAAYHGIRCALVDGTHAPDGLYRSFGFEDAAAYLDAFRAHAAVRPQWAKETVAASYATSCKGAAPALPGATTPTDGPPR